MWPHNKERDIHNYAALAERPFPVLCVIGNHEPIYGMKNIPEADIGLGEAVYQINAEPFVAYFKRGKIYTIDGIKFSVLGGALSIDKDIVNTSTLNVLGGTLSNRKNIWRDRKRGFHHAYFAFLYI